MSTEQPVTTLPAAKRPEPPAEPPNQARDVEKILAKPQNLVVGVGDKVNYGIAKATLGISRVLPCFPAARLFIDMVIGFPHYHTHPPNLTPPSPPVFLPSIGPVILAGAQNVLINGLPAARCGDIGFGAWCGGYYPLFEVFTGSSHVFIGGARAARAYIDFTRHCSASFFRKKYVGKHRSKPPKKKDPDEPGKDTPGKQRKPEKPRKEIDIEKLGLAATAVGMVYTMMLQGVGLQATATDLENAQAALEETESPSDVAAAQVKVEAAELELAMTQRQTAADLAAMALSVGMGMDPGVPPLLCLGKFLTGSLNVLIGGFPMPGWGAILGGLGKLLGRGALKLGQRLGCNHGLGRMFEPIDVVTGANVDEFTDFTLPAPRFIWRRWYNSQQQLELGPLGWGFRHEYQHELRVDESSYEFTYTDQEGNSVTFPPFITDLTGERTTQHGYVLTRLLERRYELTTHNQPAIESEFREMTERGLPIALRDEDRSFTFEYYDHTRLIRINLDGERPIRLNYSPAGLLNEVLLEQPGQENVYVARYRHDDNGRLVECRDALDQVARYEYDTERRMTHKTDRRGYSYRYRYDEQGRCVYTSGDDGMYEGWLEYHPEHKTTVVDYSDGGRWIYEYNQFGTITKIVDPYGGTKHRIVDQDTGIVLRELDQAGNPTELLYDEYGAHTGRRDPWGYWAPPLNIDPHPPNPLEHKVPETPLEWEFGNLIDKKFIGKVSPVNPLLKDFPDVASEIEQSQFIASGKEMPSTSQEKHDLVGRLRERRNEDGSTERWEYDAEGNEVLYVDGDGAEHRKEYVSWNLLHREIDPAGNSRTFQYSPTEKITQFVDAGGTVHDFHYDKKDRLVEVWRNGTRHDIYRYDEADNLIEKLDGEGRSLLRCVSGFGRLDKVREFADGEAYQYEYNERGRITRARTRRDRMVLDYDEAGRSTKDERNRLGVVNKFAYEGLISTMVFGKFVTKFRRWLDGSVNIIDPTGRSHAFYISDDGLILKELANGTRELSQYDAKGRCLRKVVSSADGAQYSKRNSYSAAGDLLLVEDNRRGRIEYHFDASHRLKIAEREDGRNELYHHDKAGNLILQPGLDA
jgi:YD repeat-containing protein